MIRIQKTTPPPSTLNNERTYEQLQIILDKNGFDNDKEKDNYRKLCRSDRIYNALCETYHHKCAFCERKQSRLLPNAKAPERKPRFTIEHYRPIKSYYWLIYSWDNLLPVCAACNGNKGNAFAISGTAALPEAVAGEQLHTLAPHYHEQEKPKMLHPEIDEEHIFEQIQYTQRGTMFAHDERCKYTIEQLQLHSSKDIDTMRKKIWEDFYERAGSLFLTSLAEFEAEVAVFVANAYMPENEFIGFRRFVIQHMHEWLHNITSESDQATN
jgi:hypothetical protein